MGFYKKDENQILAGENFVCSPVVTLKAEDKDTYEYPQDGWYWFDTFDQAIAFFAGVKDDSDSITPLQAELQLHRIGLLGRVKQMVASDLVVEIYWSRAQKFYKTDSILLGMATALGLANEQLDELFAEASKL